MVGRAASWSANAQFIRPSLRPVFLSTVAHFGPWSIRAKQVETEKFTANGFAKTKIGKEVGSLREGAGLL